MPLVVLYICAFECCSPRRCDFLIKDVGTSIHPPALASGTRDVLTKIRAPRTLHRMCVSTKRLCAVCMGVECFGKRKTLYRCHGLLNCTLAAR
ncbi:hypothetical protein COCSADRAFT_268515 [Bipolaris sorokiniana ND90Pr]|uniref:Uncharacterized protein n=1 Tax=Cochliobolus sativus (strain ND90Pr / ATCC 201652) TaxID=665912 RepID=M2T0K6_COCSN|nr:uncharacterized protein COCSADRAFT_268515 [Bipolaris sorokiniana ND90Pr]EMD68075.1 hypothetical protein COCSADRAFT_268515 [Bipolaris sorokiniana ND90Pr]